MVDDNEINQEVAKAMMEPFEMQIDLASDGQQALDMLRSEKYDLVFMDIQMPVMNGYDATRAIRALEREDARTIPIIAMTANAFAEDVKDAMDAGMDAHIAKPVDMELLKQVLKLYLR